MAKPQVSFAKRQREQAKRERQQSKVERRAQRAVEPREDEIAVEDMQPLTGNEPPIEQ